MNKIGVIGGGETVIGFKALGLDVFPVGDAAQARKVIRSITGDESPYAIIYIEENLYEPLKSDIESFKDSPVPAIILIPGRDGSLGIGRAALSEAVERAVGTDILKD